MTVTRTIVEHEVYFWRDSKADSHEIDLNQYINSGKIDCIDVPNLQVIQFLQKFDPTYVDRMDPGETDSLAYLYHSEKEWLITSSDGIVFKTLGCLAKPDQGISLEEILQKVGLTHAFDKKHRHYTKDFRLGLTKKGQADRIVGIGLKK